MRYAGFWIRLWANLVDAAVFAPLFFLVMWIEGRSRTAASVTILVGLSRISADEYLTLSSWTQRGRRLAALAPGRDILFWANEIWFWGELVVLLFNRRKRALHDLVTGTVLVHVSPGPGFPVLDPDRLGILPLLDRR